MEVNLYHEIKMAHYNNNNNLISPVILLNPSQIFLSLIFPLVSWTTLPSDTIYSAYNSLWSSAVFILAIYPIQFILLPLINLTKSTLALSALMDN